MNVPSTNGTDLPGRVFVSHSGADKEVAEHLCTALEESGIPCWIAPRDILPGKSWASSIIEGLGSCRVMLLVYSAHSNASTQVLREVERAVQRKLQLVTYRIDDTPPCDDLEYFLSTVQWLDAYTTDSGAHVEYLVKSIQHILEINVDTENEIASPTRKTPLPPPPGVTVKPARRLSSVLAIVAGILLIAVVAWVANNRKATGPALPLKPVLQLENNRNMAIFPFKNLSQTKELEWLRSGLTEMIITDLSQSKTFHVLSSQELHQAIANDNGTVEPVNSIDGLQDVSRRAGVSSVLSGSFAKIGQTLEISINIQNSLSGEILLAKRSSGSEESVFAMIDQLTGMIRDSFGRGNEDGLDKDLRDVTTTSLEAYRYYVEGLQFDLQLQREQAIPLLEKAVEIDPEFAMAHARLGWIYQNLGMAGKAAANLEAAFIHSERLPGRERYLIEGLHYTQRWETYHLAVDAFRNALALDPDLNSARHQLATLYGKLEMFRQAIELWESLRKGNYEYPGIENGLAIMYSTQGDFEKGEELLKGWVLRNPSNNLAYVALGWHYTGWGRIAEALENFDKARDLNVAGSAFLSQAIWRARVVENNYREANEVAGRMLISSNPYSKWLGYKNRANGYLLDGQSRAALEAFNKAGSAYPVPNAFTAMTWLKAADIHLQLGDIQAAILNAGRAVQEGQGEWPEWEAKFLMATAEYLQGNRREAEQISAEIAKQSAIQPGHILERMQRQLQGRFAMARGESGLAISELGLAAESLSSYGAAYHFQRDPDHASVWYDLAMAFLNDGQQERAAELFLKIINSGIERTIYPVLYVRSYYYLGRIADETGQSDKAQDYFHKFLEYWGESDLDPEALSWAKSRLD